MDRTKDDALNYIKIKKILLPDRNVNDSTKINIDPQNICDETFHAIRKTVGDMWYCLFLYLFVCFEKGLTQPCLPRHLLECWDKGMPHHTRLRSIVLTQMIPASIFPTLWHVLLVTMYALI